MSDEDDLLEIPFQSPSDPAVATGYPAGLALELALRVAKPSEVLKAYNLTLPAFQAIMSIPAFKIEYKELCEQAKDEGFSYKMKARAQAEGMLRTTWQMVQDVTTPAAVRADLIKFNARVAGFDKKDNGDVGVAADKIRITINLGDNDVKQIEGTTISAHDDDNSTDVGPKN
mgnify:FL=1|tara:strand:+ start:732 stop:1247 length:516 start_codon:yes stop_codon:yes gene_type:complete